MTNNLLPFTHPDIEQGVSKDLIASNISPLFEVKKLIWGSLLGKENNEIVRDVLFNSPNFIAYIANVRQDFISNHANYRKYPKMNEKDWE